MQQNTPALSEIDHLTIKLCLANQPAEARELLSQWDAQIDIDTMSFGIMRLVPLIVEQTIKFQLISAHQKRLKVIYKYWWVAYQTRTQQLQEVATLLNSANIPAMCIKGMVLAQHYPKPMLRAMADLDIVVPTKQHRAALKLLTDNGWHWKDPVQQLSYPIELALSLDPPHGIPVVHPVTGAEIDLHSRISASTSNAFTIQAWENAEPLNLKGTSDGTQASGISQPLLAAQLYLVIVHTAMSHPSDNLNWIIDLSKLADKASPSDWQTVIELVNSNKTRAIAAAVLNVAQQYIRFPDIVKALTASDFYPGNQIIYNEHKRWTVAWALVVIHHRIRRGELRRPHRNVTINLLVSLYGIAITCLTRPLAQILSYYSTKRSANNF